MHGELRGRKVYLDYQVASAFICGIVRQLHDTLVTARTIKGIEVVSTRLAVTAEMAAAAEPEVIYVNAEDGEPYALESLCMNCHETVSSEGWGCMLHILSSFSSLQLKFRSRAPLSCC